MTDKKRIEAKLSEFDNHVLTQVYASDDGKIKIFDYRNEDGSVFYYQRWIIDRGTLIVQGDCYEGIYRWSSSSELTLKFLANQDVGYFSSKCIADKNGSNQMEFDSDHAEQQMKLIAFERIRSCRTFKTVENLEIVDNITDDEWSDMTTEQVEELLKPLIIDEIQAYHEKYFSDLDYDGIWHHSNKGAAVEEMMKYKFLFGDEVWEYDLEQRTIVPIMHMAGLKAAFKKYPEAF